MFMDEQLNGTAVPEIQPSGSAEKMLTQSEVNSLVAREKQNAAARARQEVEREYQQRLEQTRAQQPGQDSHPNQADADAIYQQVQERFNRELQERQFQQEVTQIANSYHARIEHGKKGYADFEEVTKDFDPGAFPQLIYLLSGMDNAGDIVYDLSKNPHKLSSLDHLAQRSPKLAQAELMRLGSSISQNNTARMDAEQNSVSAPLNPLIPSRVSGSNGKMGISDLRKQNWLKG